MDSLQRGSTAEEWRPAPGWPGYEVSTLGRGRSFWNKRYGIGDKPHPLKARVNPRHGYVTFQMMKDGLRKTPKVHTLVLTTFVGPRPPGMECRHLNGDKTDNRLVNLAWGESFENKADRVAHKIRDRRPEPAPETPGAIRGPEVDGPEEFRPVRLREGYRVSNLGRVQSCWKQGQGFRWRMSEEWHDLTPTPNIRYGYLTVMLRGDGHPVRRMVHGLVADAFLGPKPPGMDTCHCDGDRTNNRLSNLRYDTRKANHADKATHGTLYRGTRHHSCKLTEAQVATIKGHLARRDVAQKDLAARFGVSPTLISRIARGLAWSHISPA